MNISLEHHGAAPAAAQLVDIDRLIWHDPTSGTIDLEDTAVRSLIIEGIHAPLTLRVPAGLEQVSLAGDLASVRLEGTPANAPLVQLWGDLSDGLPAGCDWARHLEISDTPSLDLLPLTGMAGLRELTVRNVPGPITGCSAIASASALERISFMRCYNIDVAEFPEHLALSHLTWISFDDVSAADARVLRARIDGFWNGHVRRPRSRGWLVANSDNPFRTWDGDNAELHYQATTLWNRTRSRLTHATSLATRRTIIHDFIAALDALSREYRLDTLRREQAGEAARSLAQAHLGEEDSFACWTPE